MTSEIRSKYIDAGYDSMNGLDEQSAYRRLVEVENRANRNHGDIELEWIAMGCASAYADMIEKRNYRHLEKLS